jgi:hypothetical protein
MREERGRDKVPLIELSGDGLDKPRTFTPTALGDEPGAFRVVFGSLPQGRYEARIREEGSKETAANMVFDVRSFSEEQLDLKARPDLMAQIARQSGGAVIAGDSPREIEAQLQEHLERSRPHQVRRLSAWDRWWVLLAVFGLWAVAWGLRRSAGLI